MSLLPDPNSLLEQALLWIGVPILLVVVIMTVLTVLDYVRYALSAAQAGRRAAESVAAALAVERYRSAAALLGLAASQGALLAVTYSLVQLGQVTIAEDLHDGRSYDTSEVVGKVIDYDRWTPLGSNVVLGVLLVLTLMDIGLWTRTRWLKALPALPFFPIGALCVLFAFIAFIPGCCVLVLGATEDDGPYSVEMSVFYGLWVALMLGWAMTAVWTFSSADRLERLLG